MAEEREATRAALVASEARYRELFEHMRSGVAVYEAVDQGRDFVFRDFNRAAEAIERVERASVIGRRVTEVFPGVVEFGLLGILQRVWESGEPARFPAAVYGDDRIAGWRENHVYRLPSGEVVAIYDDVTEAKQAEEALRASERELRALFDGLADAVLIVDLNGRILASNRAAGERYGLSAEALTGASVRSLDTPAAAARVPERLAEILATGGAVFETEQVGRDGTVIPTEISSRVIPFRGSRAILSVCRDITDRKRAAEALAESERRLWDAQRLEAVGSLAGGVAHDFNNLLQVILSTIEVTRVSLHDPDRTRKRLAEMEDNVRRGAQLSRQLLLFSRREATRMQPLDLNDAIRNALGMLQRLLRENVSVEVDLDAGPVPVLGDLGQLEQVVTNLLLNAADAMPRGGRLQVRSGITDRTAWLVVEDQGVGIPPEIQERIFEPFFTSKPQGRGTGLGLPVVQGIVVSHGGQVEISSRVGEGTVVRVELPTANHRAHPAEPVPQEYPEVMPEAWGEQVLVIEDEAGAREALCAILTTLGYRPHAVATGEAALALPPEPAFELVLTDVMLPGISGPDTAVELRKR
ncbi:MAG: PAS domain S-box protein [Thermoanaerobaculaceae bacterium]|nr:PAS domain S-box protein [Thermoanaerobaculaceae bacterium]MDI9622569.1 PAS domain S-box protein [Acidobacteriota bacterium]NLH09892.1 PAS domain S-box protein [Holophagae bacterium]